jgi:hypothetical protein
MISWKAWECSRLTVSFSNHASGVFNTWSSHAKESWTDSELQPISSLSSTLQWKHAECVTIRQYPNPIYGHYELLPEYFSKCDRTHTQNCELIDWMISRFSVMYRKEPIGMLLVGFD